MSSSSLSNDKWVAVVATAFAGIAAGALAFVSAAETRSFFTHLRNKDTDLIKRHFKVWWPFGRDFMAPILVCGLVSNIAAYLQTDDITFAVAGGLVGANIPYTMFVLGEDIGTLLKANPQDVDKTTRRFCNLHHLRLVSASTGFVLSLLALARL